MSRNRPRVRYVDLQTIIREAKVKAHPIRFEPLVRCADCEGLIERERGRCDACRRRKARSEQREDSDERRPTT